MNLSDPETLFKIWWRDHRGILFKVARSFATDATAQSELLQEMMVQLWRSIKHFRAEARPSTWIYRVCLNTAQTWRRSTARREQWLSPLPEISELSCPAPSPTAAHENAELLTALYAAIRALPTAERSLVLLLLDGLSYRDMADITGLTENAIGVALTRSRKKLAEAMKEVRDEV